jgi:hypothetical protein
MFSAVRDRRYIVRFRQRLQECFVLVNSRAHAPCENVIDIYSQLIETKLPL